VARLTRPHASRRLVPNVDSVARDLLGPLCRVLIAAGMNSSQVLDACAHVLKAFSSRPPKSLRIVEYDPTLELAVSLWTTDHRYLRDGVPATLAVGGPAPSFRSLLRLAATRRSPVDALKQLKSLGVVGIRQGRVKLLRNFLPIASKGGVNLTSASRIAADFLRAWTLDVTANVRPGRGIFLRTAHNFSMHRSIVPAFDRFTREQSHLLLESVDQWLTKRSKGPSPPRRSNARHARLGLGIYVINDAFTLSKPRTSRSKGTVRSKA